MKDIFKPKVIVFSGGCFSGKTTTLNTFAAKTDNAHVLGENIRNKGYTSIDDIRADASAYLTLQIEAITQKMNDEKNAFATLTNDDVVFVDRSIIDSLFYLTFYVDKHSLSDYDMDRFDSLLTSILEHAKWAFSNFYDKVLFFKPLELECNDGVHRPAKIDALKHIESVMIYSLLGPYINKVVHVDLNDDSNRAFTLERLYNETI